MEKYFTTLDLSRARSDHPINSKEAHKEMRHVLKRWHGIVDEGDYFIRMYKQELLNRGDNLSEGSDSPT